MGKTIDQVNKGVPPPAPILPDDLFVMRRSGKDYPVPGQPLAEFIAPLVSELAGTMASPAEAESAAPVGKYMNPARTREALVAGPVVLRVGNVAEMSALDVLRDGTRVAVEGYYTTVLHVAPDGGGGDFVYQAGSTAVVNGVTVFAATGMGGVGRIHRLHRGKISFREGGAKGDWNGITGTDDTSRINAVLSCGLRLVDVGAGAFVVDGVINTPKGTNVEGLTDYVDCASKNLNTDSVKDFGSVLVMRGAAAITLENNTKWSKCVIYYPDQNYTILADGGQPDGLSPFVSYAPTFTLNAAYGACKLEKLIYIGGSTILKCPSTTNAEKLKVSDITGVCTKLAFDVEKSTDTVFFRDVHLNPNVALREITNRGGSFNNFCTKVGKNADVFRFSNNDGVEIYGCFAYSCKRFIDVGGSGAGLSIVNSAADICNTFIYHDALRKPFGTQVSNSWATPSLNNVVEGGSVVSRGARLVYFGPAASDHKVLISNCDAYSAVVSTNADSGLWEHAFEIDASNPNRNRVLVNNTNIRTLQKGLAKGFHIHKNAQARPYIHCGDNVIVNELPWGRDENILADGWGEEGGMRWTGSGITGRIINNGTDDGPGLRLTIDVGGYAETKVRYFEQASRHQWAYLALVGAYTSIAAVQVVLDVLDVTGVFVSNLYTGSLTDCSKRTDLQVPAAGGDVFRYLRFKLLNNGAESASFSFVAGFANNTSFPKIAPSGYPTPASIFMSGANQSFTSVRAAICNVLYDSPMTAARTVTPNALTPGLGDRVRVALGAGATGGFTVSLGGLYNVAINEWAEVIYNGTSWAPYGKGSMV